MESTWSDANGMLVGCDVGALLRECTRCEFFSNVDTVGEVLRGKVGGEGF